MEGNSSLNYFTCTLGDASSLTKSSPEFATVNKLLEVQANRHPEYPAAAFPVLLNNNHGQQYDIFTFKDLYEGSLEAAACFSWKGHAKRLDKPLECVALLCHSSISFLFAWLGLMRAGYSVLLIAPQCSPAAIFTLSTSCEASLLYHDEAHTGLASSLEAEKELKPIHGPEVSSEDVAYIHHSSGTSSGIPKPIAQTHHGVVAVLPCLQGQDAATFTTTPLYHGGIADCFRAWTSNALIWLCPGADAPITSETILSCLSISKIATEKENTPVVRYFSSVPYILQMLSEISGGLKALQDMDIVGVGGAALPETVGDRLVEENVHLVSRFGSAECGFLLSSHRHYPTDRNWQHLRVPNTDSLLRFEGERYESDLSELIVLPDWPHMAKRNRDDGSYATCDMFQPYPTVKNAWKYHSRSDCQITLLTGKKFDPAPIEDAIRSSSLMIEDIFIFGSGRQIAGAIVLPSKSVDHTSKNTRHEIWKVIQMINSQQQPHARVSQIMFKILDNTCPPLERSSKGTILRGQTERYYASTIDSMYHPGSSTSDKTEKSRSSFSDQVVDSTIRTIVAEVLGNDIDLSDDSDFFHHGVDSTKATQIRSSLQQSFRRSSLPWNIVYDYENIKGLIRYFSESQTQKRADMNNDSHQGMMHLVENYSNFNPPQISNEGTVERSQCGHTVILTGATGGLGAHILNGLRGDSAVSQIICLVRAEDDTTAWTRVSKSLTQRRLHPLSSPDSDQNVLCIPTQLAEPDLGFSAETLSNLSHKVTHIIHAAWAVNFSVPLSSFAKEHLSGLQHLINFAESCRRFEQFAFCSSTASVIAQAQVAGDNPIREEIYPEPPPENSLGYSKSKWVAEAICSKATGSSRLSGKMKILRIGQLTGDTKNGVWNRSEARPLMLSTAPQLSCLPKLDEKLSWLPVDVAAQAVLNISLLSQSTQTASPCTVYHLVNNDQTTAWLDLLDWVKKQSTEEILLAEPTEWLEKLEQLDHHPAKSLLGLWKNSLGNVGKDVDTEDKIGPVVFDTENASNASQFMQDVAPVDEVLVGKIWQFLQNT
ncbi:hypothetical protein BKA65DRAFT_610060 [Rhexocercosporidium sp. MPI-PUGE-AT-0058]|nr:hypothetical protein BKA65DRAFT_610060 [Rhexocercosporidium sp. MPI-PUGE-AT-0058]